MIIGFADRGWEDYQHWMQKDKKIVKRINLLLEDIKRKPERLKDNFAGYFSRRITAEHRLVYTLIDDLIGNGVGGLLVYLKHINFYPSILYL